MSPLRTPSRARRKAELVLNQHKLSPSASTQPGRVERSRDGSLPGTAVLVLDWDGTVPSGTRSTWRSSASETSRSSSGSRRSSDRALTLDEVIAAEMATITRAVRRGRRVAARARPRPPRLPGAFRRPRPADRVGRLPRADRADPRARGDRRAGGREPRRQPIPRGWRAEFPARPAVRRLRRAVQARRVDGARPVRIRRRRRLRPLRLARRRAPLRAGGPCRTGSTSRASSTSRSATCTTCSRLRAEGLEVGPAARWCRRP